MARGPAACSCYRPTAIARYLALRYGARDQEVMGALFVDVRNRLVGEREIFRGGGFTARRSSRERS